MAKKTKTKIKVVCKVKFASASASRVRDVGIHLSRGGHLFAIGSARAHGGEATVPMRELRKVHRGLGYNVRIVARVPKAIPTTSVGRVTVR